MYGCYLRRDLHGYFQFNQFIHQKIVAAARNVTSLFGLRKLRGKAETRTLLREMARDRNRWSEAMREHETILDTLRRRAGGELSDILFHRLRNKRRALVERSDIQTKDA